MKKILMIMVIMLIGCWSAPLLPFHYIESVGGYHSANRVIPIWVDKNFGEADQVMIDDAITQWNYALNGYIRLEVRSREFDMEVPIIKRVIMGDGWLILKVNSDNPMINDADGKWTLAWANMIGGNRIYMIRSRVRNEWVNGVMMHEMGHLLGAEHDEAYLMRSTFNWSECRCIDYSTLEMVAKYQGIMIDKLNYCVYGSSAKQ